MKCFVSLGYLWPYCLRKFFTCQFSLLFKQQCWYTQHMYIHITFLQLVPLCVHFLSSHFRKRMPIMTHKHDSTNTGVDWRQKWPLLGIMCKIKGLCSEGFHLGNALLTLTVWVEKQKAEFTYWEAVKNEVITIYISNVYEDRVSFDMTNKF